MMRALHPRGLSLQTRLLASDDPLQRALTARTNVRRISPDGDSRAEPPFRRSRRRLVEAKGHLPRDDTPRPATASDGARAHAGRFLTGAGRPGSVSPVVPAGEETAP